MESLKTARIGGQNENKSNLKRQKLVQYLNKKHTKRTISFFGFVAKLQQALKNRDSYFVYYVNNRIHEFLKVLMACGFVQAYYLAPQEVQEVKLAPYFKQRALLVYLKPSNKFGTALSSLKLFSVPSRSTTITYAQLVTKALGAGTAKQYMLNTSKGLLTHTRALQYKVGGELVCEIN